MITRTIPAELAIAAARLAAIEDLAPTVDPGKVLAFANKLVQVADACPGLPPVELASHWQPVSGRRPDYRMLPVTMPNEWWISRARLFGAAADFISCRHITSSNHEPDGCPTCTSYHDARLLADWCRADWKDGLEPEFPA
jgi:hypothetical protein